VDPKVTGSRPVSRPKVGTPMQTKTLPPLRTDTPFAEKRIERAKPEQILGR
jgi:hypothetical protein